jgi:hypothetical protein
VSVNATAHSNLALVMSSPSTREATLEATTPGRARSRSEYGRERIAPGAASGISPLVRAHSLALPRWRGPDQVGGKDGRLPRPSSFDQGPRAPARLREVDRLGTGALLSGGGVLEIDDLAFT